MCTLVTQNNKFKIACDSIGQDTAVYLHLNEKGQSFENYTLLLKTASLKREIKAMCVKLE